MAFLLQRFNNRSWPLPLDDGLLPIPRSTVAVRFYNDVEGDRCRIGYACDALRNSSRGPHAYRQPLWMRLIGKVDSASLTQSVEGRLTRDDLRVPIQEHFRPTHQSVITGLVENLRLAPSQRPWEGGLGVAITEETYFSVRYLLPDPAHCGQRDPGYITVDLLGRVRSAVANEGLPLARQSAIRVHARPDDLDEEEDSGPARRRARLA